MKYITNQEPTEAAHYMFAERLELLNSSKYKKFNKVK